MIRPGTIVWLLLVIAVGYAMFQVKYEVMQQEETLARLNKDIADSREQIRVIDAEWSYLTRPDRLKRLAARYLNLAPIAAAQIAELSTVPERNDAPPALVPQRTLSPPAQPMTARPMPPQAIERKVAAVDKGVSP
jgi:hypothetical protein